MEPMTRIELVTSPLPRGCSTAKLHGHGIDFSPLFCSRLFFGRSVASLLLGFSAVIAVFLKSVPPDLVFASFVPDEAKNLGGAGFEPA